MLLVKLNNHEHKLNNFGSLGNFTIRELSVNLAPDVVETLNFKNFTWIEERNFSAEDKIFQCPGYPVAVSTDRESFVSNLRFLERRVVDFKYLRFLTSIQYRLFKVINKMIHLSLKG